MSTERGVRSCEDHLLASLKFPIGTSDEDITSRKKLLSDKKDVKPEEAAQLLGKGDWTGAAKAAAKVMGGEGTVINEGNFRLFLTLVQRYMELLTAAGSLTPTDVRYLSFNEFQSVISIFPNWGCFLPDIWEAFRAAGAADTPGGSLLSTELLADYTLSNSNLNCPNAGFDPPKYYKIAAPAAIIREEISLTSPQVGDQLLEGSEVTVVDIIGRRGRVTSPVVGWMSMKTSKGEEIAVEDEIEEESLIFESIAPSPSGTEATRRRGSPGINMFCSTRTFDESICFELIEGTTPRPSPNPEARRRKSPSPAPYMSTRTFDDTIHFEPLDDTIATPATTSTHNSKQPASQPAQPACDIPAPQYRQVRPRERDTSVTRTRNFAKPTQSACMRILNEEGQTDFKKYPFDFQGYVSEPNAINRATRGRSGSMSKSRNLEFQYALGKKVVKSRSSSAAFRSTTKRELKNVIKSADELGPGAYAPDSQFGAAQPARSNTPGRSHTRLTNSTSQAASRASTPTRGRPRPGFGSSVTRGLPKNRACGPAISSYQVL
eukprot:TRINITY_DN25199_c0_g1_i1.p1 TRINITY_DN25199_c0_g1~~TRINITY_DN25199_c0_g1_i1.p1  ORF type:complete len:556 (+),score=101.44 TRINITY_DN25199_c0_g1_i1:30-1670(+)